MVYQDFELNYSLPPNHLLWKLATTLEGLMSLALTKISAEWVPPATYTTNDLIFFSATLPAAKGSHRIVTIWRIE